MLACQREAFEIPDGVAYFNCAYMAPMLGAVRRAGEAALARVAAPWQLGGDDFFAPPERARALFAQLIGAQPQDVAITPSASFGLSTAARNLQLGAGQVILLVEEAFPSNVYPWQALAERSGGELRRVRRPADSDWTSAILAELQELGDRVAIAALPNCHWTDGSFVDLAQVSPALQRLGAKLVVDATQSLGALPLDVTRVKIDYLACAAYKWLLGPYSTALLYVAPEHHGGEPLDLNWATRAGAEDFTALVGQAGYQPGARRFDMGERASFVLLPMLIAALEQVTAWTPAAIQQPLGGLTERIAAGAAELGATAPAPAFRAPHLLGLRFAAGAAARIACALRQEQIFVSVRGQTLRIAPHLHTSERDLERLLDALARHARR